MTAPVIMRGRLRWAFNAALRVAALGLVVVPIRGATAQPSGSAVKAVKVPEVIAACRRVALRIIDRSDTATMIGFCGLADETSFANWQTVVVPTADMIRKYAVETGTMESAGDAEDQVRFLIEDVLAHFSAYTADSATRRAALEEIRKAVDELKSRSAVEHVVAEAAAPLPSSLDSAELAGFLKGLVPVGRVAAMQMDLSGGGNAPTALKATGSFTPAAPSPATFVSNALWGVSDFVVDKAQEQARILAIQLLADRLCGEASTFASYASHSCRLLSPTALTDALPPITAVRAAMQADIQLLPFAAVTQASALIAGAGDTLAKRRAMVLGSAANVAGRLLAGETLEGSFLRAFDTPGAARLFDARIGDGTAAQLILQIRDLLATTVADDGSVWTLDSRDAALQLRYMLMTLAVNARSDPRWPGYTAAYTRIRLRFDAPRLARLTQATQSAYATLTAARDKLSGLRARAATPEEQRAVLAEVAKAAIDVARPILSDRDFAVGRADVLLDGLTETAEALAARRYDDLWVVMTDMLDWAAGNTSVSLSPTETRVLAFAGALSAADSPQSAQQAINDFASSSNGYMRKRSHLSRHWFSVNAYLGAFGGRENAASERRYFGGLSLPVGMEMGWPNGIHLGKDTRTPRLGLFLQLVDLGALASWRFGESADSIENRPEVGFGQIFSPGITLLHPIGKYPLTIGAAVNWSPELRTYKDFKKPLDKDRVNTVRYGLMFAFDVPIFP